MPHFEIAIVDSNILAALGLQPLLTDIIPVAEVHIFISFGELQAADHFKIGTLAILHLDVGGGELIDPLVNFFLGGEYGLQLLVRIQLRIQA